MAIYPFAVQQIIPESHTQGRIAPTTLIYHEAVSSADSLQNYWNTPGVELESHFYIGKTGTIYQFVDTAVRADANYYANSFAISVETWDNGGDVNLAWNPAMLAAAKRLAAWVCEVHGIKRAAPSSWNSGGIGGHNWFANEWAGGPRDCPGRNRSAQIRNDIIPYVAAGGGWRDTSMEDDVDLNDSLSPYFWDRRKANVGDALANTWNLAADAARVAGEAAKTAARVEAKIDALGKVLSDDEANILAAVRAQPTGGQVDVTALADQLRTGLGEEIAQNLGRRLLGSDTTN